MPEETPTTRRLIRSAQTGDDGALEKLFSRTYPDLLQAARIRMGRELRHRVDSLDIAHSAYYEALRSLPRYRDRGRGSFRRWLLGILENKIRNLVYFNRAQRRDVRRERPLDDKAPLVSPSTSPVTRVLDNEDRARLEAAMDALSPAHREVIVGRYYLRMPWKEIAARLDRTEEAAQMLCQRALQKLKLHYEE